MRCVRKLQLTFIPFKEIPIGYLVFVKNFEHFDYVISSYRLRLSLPNKDRILIDSACVFECVVRAEARWEKKETEIDS